MPLILKATFFQKDPVSWRHLRPTLRGIILYELITAVLSLLFSAVAIFALGMAGDSRVEFSFRKILMFNAIPVAYVQASDWEALCFLILGSWIISEISTGSMSFLSSEANQSFRKSISLLRALSQPRNFWETKRFQAVSIFFSWVILQICLWFFDGRH